MARKSDFMKWIDHQVDTDADLKRKVDEYLIETMIEQKLAALRSQRAMTQAQLAQRFGVSQRHIAKLEAGRAKEHRAAHSVSLGDRTWRQAHGRRRPKRHAEAEANGGIAHV